VNDDRTPTNTYAPKMPASEREGLHRSGSARNSDHASRIKAGPNTTTGAAMERQDSERADMA